MLVFHYLNFSGGFIPGSIGETSVFFILIGAALLLVTRGASWQIMAGSILGVYIMGWILNASATATNLPFLAVPPEYHLLMGSFAFGAVFMATDPVSAPDLKGIQVDLWYWNWCIYRYYSSFKSSIS